MRQPRLLPALAAAFMLAGCGDKEPDTLLGYVPADTPYVFANVEPMTKATIDAWARRFEPLAAMYEEMLETARADLAKSGKAKEPVGRAAQALLEELEGNISVAGFEKLGFTTQAHWALYGIGLVPVMRLELGDPKAVEALLVRIEKRMGEAIPAGSVGKHAYRRIGGASGEIAVLLAIADGDLVLSLVPRQASEDLLKRLLGIERPDTTLEDDAPLASLNREYGYTPYGSGYFDLVRIAHALVDEKSGIEKEFLKALGVEDKPVAAACRSEFLELAANMPRVAFGYTRFDAMAIDTRMVLEAKPALAAEFRTLAAPVPGLGQPSTALMDFGMSLKLDKLNDMVGAHARAIAAAPYQCAQLAELNTAAAELQTQLSNPVTFAAAPVFKGFRAALTRFEMDADLKPEFAGKLVVASDNPQSLVALAQSFVPQLKGMALKPGGAPVALPADLAPPGTPPTHVAMAGNAIGFAVGAGEETDLAQFIATKAADPPPLFAFGYSGRFLSTMMEMSAKAGKAEMSAEQRAEMERMLETVGKVYGEMVDRLETSLVATDRGLEILQSMRFK